MKISDPVLTIDSERFRALVIWDVVSLKELHAAVSAAAARSVSIEKILRYEMDISRRRLLEALSDYYGCDWIEYDERTPVPPDILKGLNADSLCENLWFPVIRDSETSVIAVNDPGDKFVTEQAKRMICTESCEFRVALEEDILYFIQDFLNSAPEHLIGNERTGLAFWRNTMSRWRTRLACYRTDFAIARTHFGSLRWGLGLITTGRTMLHLQIVYLLWPPLCWVMIGIGSAMIFAGAASYFRIKKSIISPPAPQTIIEVSAATLHFLEYYQFAENMEHCAPSRQTMLSRLSDLLPRSCVFIENSTDNKVRSYLAHERTSLAAQRTVLACYRTIYARARTGLSFIRTGVSFTGIGFGLIQYFGFSLMSFLDVFIILAGVLMIADGIVWYWPVRKEQKEAPEMTC